MAQSVGMLVSRGAATLTPAQADKIRDHSRGLRAGQNRAAATPPPMRPSARGATAQTTAKTPTVPPRVGPPHACACCGLSLPGSPPLPTEEVEPERCSTCESHYAFPGEDAARRLSRLQEHEMRLRTAYAVTWSREQEAETKMRAGCRSRDNWRGTLVQVMDLHEEVGTGGCGCGAKTFPCSTWKALERTNRGIIRQVEEFLALKDDERDRRLYGLDHWDHDVA